jgi:hypothetical protein
MRRVSGNPTLCTAFYIVNIERIAKALNVSLAELFGVFR